MDFYQRVGTTCNMLLARDLENAFDAIDELQHERPDAAEVLYLMGIAAVTMEEYGRGLIFIEEAHNTDPDCFEYSDVLANLHVRVGNLSEGVYFAKLSTTLEPHPHVRNLVPPDMRNFFESLEKTAIPRHRAYGFVSLHRHEYTDAAREFDRQVLLTPEDDTSYRYGSRAHQMLGNFERAITYAQKAVALAPDDMANHFQAGKLSQAIGADEAAMFHYLKVAELDQKSPQDVAAALASAMQLPNGDSEALTSIKSALADRMAEAPSLPPEATASLSRKEKIHIGYVTNSDWSTDTVALLEPFLELHDRSRFNVHIYQQTQGRSAYIKYLNNLADSERRLWELDDEIASIVIAGDEIDVLVNMCAPASDNRASLFAMAPSAIQVGYLGMNFGLGMPGITHVLSDPMTDDLCREQAGPDQKIVQVEPGLWSIKPPNMLPEVTQLPAEKNGYLTLGLACDLAALTKSAIKTLAEILKAFPESRLVFGASGATDTYVSRRIEQLFGEIGLSDRVSVWPHKAVGDPWDSDPGFWSNVDLFLVPDALSAPLRAAEALWMGVPMLTLKGTQRPIACAASSILASANKPEWIYGTTEDLINQISAFASDLGELADLRAELRNQMRRSALFNPLVHVRAMETLFVAMVDSRDDG
ncbi:MAG: hypothetical protein RIA64_03910 [Rhodospirillales bacterium]